MSSLKTLLTFATLLYVSPTFATRLFATHYNGTISTLALEGLGSKHTLTKIASLQACGKLPSWLTLDKDCSTLYCSDESGSPNGTLSAFSVSPNGTLNQLADIETLGGGVNSVEYGGLGGKNFPAIAHYSASAVATFALPINASSKALQTFTYTLPHPRPDPASQDIPHPHQVILDPTEKFILNPDLGTDVVRVFAIDAKSGKLSECPSLKTKAGSGPRHAAFWTSKSVDYVDPMLSQGHAHHGRRCAKCGSKNTTRTMMYLASELSNDVNVFSVSYPVEGCMSFDKTQTASTFPGPAPNGSAVGEIRVKGDYVYVTNRNANSTGPLMDSIAKFCLDTTTGALTFDELSSAFGFYPRTFVVNKVGDKAAIGDQLSGTVVVVARDTKTGKLGPELASISVGPTSSISMGGGLSSVIWNE